MKTTLRGPSHDDLVLALLSDGLPHGHMELYRLGSAT